MLVGRHAQTRSHTREEPDTHRDCTHRRGSHQGTDQTPTRQGHTRTRPDQTQTDPHGRPPTPRATHDMHTHPEARHGPGNQHHQGGHITPHRSPAVPGACSVQASSECVHSVCVCLYVCKERPPPRPEPCSPPRLTPTKPRLSAQDAGLQPQLTPLTWRDGGMDADTGGTPRCLQRRQQLGRPATEWAAPGPPPRHPGLGQPHRHRGRVRLRGRRGGGHLPKRSPRQGFSKRGPRTSQGIQRANDQNYFLDDSKRFAFFTLTFSQAGIPRSFPEAT